MPSQLVIEITALLDRLLDESDPDVDSPEPDEVPIFDEARQNLRAGGAELVDEATAHLWSYYRDVAGEFTPDERADYGIPEIDADADIWSHVSFRFPPQFELGRNEFCPARSYISFEGEVSWEPEHGLQLVFEHGRRVCKVGPYDGHLTNAHAYGDLSLLDVVYRF